MDLLEQTCSGILLPPPQRLFTPDDDDDDDQCPLTMNKLQQDPGHTGKFPEVIDRLLMNWSPRLKCRLCPTCSVSSYLRDVQCYIAPNAEGKGGGHFLPTSVNCSLQRSMQYL